MLEPSPVLSNATQIHHFKGTKYSTFGGSVGGNGGTPDNLEGQKLGLFTVDRTNSSIEGRYGFYGSYPILGKVIIGTILLLTTVSIVVREPHGPKAFL